MTVHEALAGKTVLITGANRGIGASFVDAVMAAGAARVNAGARDIASLAEARASYGDRLAPVRIDLADPASIDAACAEVGEIDVLISNAGRGGGGGVLEIPDEEVRDLFEVHAFGPLQLARALAPGIRARRGGMIFVHSTAALSLSRNGPAYSASKAAGMMLALAMREALMGDGVRVTSVFPGFTNTDIIRSIDIVKAEPRDVADRSLAAWAEGEACVFPDRFAELVHEQLQTDIDGLLDDPGRVMTALVQRYAAGG